MALPATDELRASAESAVQICTRCTVDSTVPGVHFDEGGVCNHCYLYDRMEQQWPAGPPGQAMFDEMVEGIKRTGKGRKYDCVVGFSGGTDSTYLLHLLKQRGVRPLAVHFDNGWNTETSVSNIKKALEALEFDLYTYVVDWEEFKDVLVAFLRASFPWADYPTDMGLRGALTDVALKHGIKYVLDGRSFRNEGKLPAEWAYCDARMLKHIQRTYGTVKLKSLPVQTLSRFVFLHFARGLHIPRPLNFIDYDKAEARKLLERDYGWEYYGGHHFENVYTRFVYSYLLPKKFGIDMRKVTYSPLVRRGAMDRAEALDELSRPSASDEQLQQDRDYVIKKLGLSEREFAAIMVDPPKSFRDFPSYYPMFHSFRSAAKVISTSILGWTPPFLFEMEGRKE